MKEILKEYISKAAYECITYRNNDPKSFQICGDDIRGQQSAIVMFMYWSDTDKHTAESLSDLTAVVLYIVIKGV